MLLMAQETDDYTLVMLWILDRLSALIFQRSKAKIEG